MTVASGSCSVSVMSSPNLATSMERILGSFELSTSGYFRHCSTTSIVVLSRRGEPRHERARGRNLSPRRSRQPSFATVVIRLRQGRKFEVLGKYRNLDTVQVAERVIVFHT